MGNLPVTYKIKAPAKLNICLKVTGRRPDGYHELVSIMVPVGIYDYLEFTKDNSQRVTLSCEGFSVPEDEENLVCRAAKAFFSHAGLRPGLCIRLFKNIPVAAGLGGGSSDAAALLMALNEIWLNPLTHSDLASLAAGLGADVPFFLERGPCLARGIGDILDPIHEWPSLWYVIVTPHLKVSTAWVYKDLKLKLTTNENDFIIQALELGITEPASILENDLETVTAARFPIINIIKKSLIDEGAEGALMSGSGPSVFGLFKSGNQALSAERHLASLGLGDVFAVEGVPRDYWGVVKR